jgi:hypothetical protein
MAESRDDGHWNRSMPAKNLYHQAVVNALVKDGWTITHDPLTITFGGRDLFVYLGAEHSAFAAEKDEVKIAIEVQSFVNPSPMRDLQEAIGQYVMHRAAMSESEPSRVLYLAVPQRAYEGVFADNFGHFVVHRLRLKLITFDETQEKVQWIS